jgi:hypothetical protein
LLFAPTRDGKTPAGMEDTANISVIRGIDRERNQRKRLTVAKKALVLRQ